MNDNVWIAYVGPFSFPWGEAGSRRVSGIAHSIADSGHDIVICSGDKSPLKITILNESETSGSITYIGLDETPKKGIPLKDKLLQLFINWGRNTVNWLNVQQNKPSHIIVYGGSAQYVYRLIPWCKRNNIPLIVDVVEWYDPSHMTGGFFGPFHVSAKIALRYYYPKCDGVIAISSYLEKFYHKHGCIVTCVPPTLDVNNCLLNNTDNDRLLTLVYAGTPGKKDLLANIIRGIYQVDPLGQRVKLLVMGPTIKQVEYLIKTTQIPPFLDVLGKIPQTDVSKAIQQADFTVLLREPKRFAQAGFPTKFVESLVNGTPIIANITTDLAQYFNDNVEGLVCPSFSENAFANTLKRALLLTAEQRLGMRIAARQQAEKSFDFRNYSAVLSNFLELCQLSKESK